MSATLDYTSYIGGNLYDNTYDSALDNNGNIYLTGQTFSSAFTQINTTISSSSLDQNCFVTKFNIAQPETSLTIIFGGNKKEVCRKIRIDSHQNIYVIGETQSSDFIVSNNSSLQGDWDGFVVKLNPNLQLAASTYIGGNDTDFAHGLSIINDSQVAVVGETWSTDFPTTANAYIQDCSLLDICDRKTANAFLLILNTQTIDSNSLVFSTYLGGSSSDKAHTVTSNETQVIVAGETQSHDFPLKNQIINTLKGSLDAFITIFSITTPTSLQLSFSTYLGGNSNDNATDIQLDKNQNIIVIGETSSDDFPVTQNSFSSKCADGNAFCATPNNLFSDIYVAKISQNLNLEYATLYGGSKNEVPTSLLITDQNNWWIAGITQSSDLPITDNAAFQTCNYTKNCIAEHDGFLLHINSEFNDKQSLSYATYFGGDRTDDVQSFHINQNKMFVIGNTDSMNMASNNSLNTTQQNGDSFISLIELPTSGKYVVKEKVVSKSPDPARSASLNQTIILGFYLFLMFLRGLYKQYFGKLIKKPNKSALFFKKT